MVNALNFSAAAVIINCVLSILIDVYGCAPFLRCLQSLMLFMYQLVATVWRGCCGAHVIPSRCGAGRFGKSTRTMPVLHFPTTHGSWCAFLVSLHV